MEKIKVAAVMTCFNRREKTEACLEALFRAAQAISDKVSLHIIVTDDGSRDGTSEMIQERFPAVDVLRGDGSLFWNGGMRLAFGKALAQGHDFYLWVNDDTTLFTDCLSNLLATHESLHAQTGRSGLVVGSTRDASGKVTYGGLYRPNTRKPLKFKLIQPQSEPQPCESSNGNCVLISAEAAAVLGNLEASYVHGMGDMDYGLRASKAGIPIWVMPGFVGTCDHDHPVGNSYLDTTLPLSVRWKKALSPKELNPKAWGTFCRRHAGIFWPLYWVWPYAKVVLTSAMHWGGKHRASACLALIAAAVLSAMPDPVTAADSVGPTLKPLPANFFGMHIHRADTTTRWPFVRFGTWRLWDAGVTWNNIETSRGQYRFEKLDLLVSKAIEQGVEPVFVLGMTPQWASSRPYEQCPYGMGCSAEPSNMADWENFIRTLATRYKGRIRYYELWNEPKFSEFETATGAFYSGKLSNLVEMGRVAARVLKEVSPSNRLITPGFTGEGDRLERFLEAGGKEYCDVIAFHFYARNPERMLVKIRTVQRIMSRQGVADRELWNTEQGYEVVGPEGMPGTMGFEVPDMETQAAYIPRSLALAGAAGVSRFYFYSWERLLTENETVPTVGAHAYGVAVRWLKDTSIDSCRTEDDAVWVCSLRRKGRNAWMVWNAGTASAWTIPIDWNIHAYESADGQAGGLEQASIAIGQTPILLKQEALLW